MFKSRLSKYITLWYVHGPRYLHVLLEQTRTDLAKYLYKRSTCMVCYLKWLDRTTRPWTPFQRLPIFCLSIFCSILSIWCKQNQKMFDVYFPQYSMSMHIIKICSNFIPEKSVSKNPTCLLVILLCLSLHIHAKCQHKFTLFQLFIF